MVVEDLIGGDIAEIGRLSSCGDLKSSTSTSTTTATYDHSTNNMRPKPRPYICTACLRHTLPTRSLTTTPNPTPSSPPSKPTPSPTTKKPLHDLTPRDHNYYWETTPPSASQLASASTFFTPTPTSPALLWSAAKFRTTPTDSQRPEVAFLGRSNVGKSSVLNAILGREICHTSSKPGRTREMNAFGIGMSATATDGPGAQPRIVLLDMPGYGKASRAEWGVEIMKYLKGRRQYVCLHVDQAAG